MTGVLSGFAIIATVIAVGYLAGRTRLITPAIAPGIARLTFFITTPSLLFTILAQTDVGQILSPLLVVPLITAVVTFSLYAVIARLVWHRSVAQTTMGSLAAGYVNSNNIGLPVAVYVLGSAAFVAPLLLGQLLIITPIALAILDASTGDRVSVGRVLLNTVRNPIIVGSALGTVVAISGITLPDVVMEPFHIIGAATVPLLLMNFGASLHGLRVLRAGPERKDVVLASATKMLVGPATAWLVGAFAFGLTGHELFVVVAIGALPTAQNVFNYAQRYRAGEVVVRDTILITTIGALPVLLLVAALLK